jgi:putative ABC transport system permease protein
MVVSAIGIANTMFIALFERTEEIGIMKAVGASNANVMWMIVFECIVTGLLAGVISLLIASVVAMIGNGYLLDYFESRSKIKLDGQVFVINLSISAIAFFLAVMVTTVAGIWPAWRAARLDPVVAMGRT